MEKENLKIIFMGTSEFARGILEALYLNKYQIAAVFCQPDKKSGRDKEIRTGSVKEFSEGHKLLLFQPPKINEEVMLKVKEINPDLIIVAAYGKIIPKELLEIPKYKSINVHPSLLPKYRGPSPIQNAILAGEKETGVSIMLMDEKIDHGDLLAQKIIEISPEDTTETLTKRLIPVSSNLLLETIPPWTDKKIKPQKQDDEKATYCQLIEKEDGHIFWDSPAEEIYNKYRAFQPWPGIFSIWISGNDLLRIKLTKLRIENKKSIGNYQLGEIFKLERQVDINSPISELAAVGVNTSEGIIILEEVQLEAKKPVRIGEFINGYPNFIGSIFK